MPLPPANPVGAPDKDVYEVSVPAVGTAGNDLVTPGVIVQRTGYLTAARYQAQAAYTGAATNNRTWTVVDPTTRVVADGVTTLNSTTVTSATGAFTQDDAGKTISGTGIPASTTIQSVVNSTTVILSAAATATGSSISITIGASRTLATLTGVSGTNLVADAEKDLVLSGTDTKVYAGDEIHFASTHVGTGLADPGGTLQLEVTNYGEGSD